MRARINFTVLSKIIIYGLISSVVFIAATLAIDTYFWRVYYDNQIRIGSTTGLELLKVKGLEEFYMWPELYVLYYNTYLNKSHEWGVSPWHWYFTAAIPKSVTVALAFIAIGLVYKTKGGLVDYFIVQIISPALIFVGLYSLLPHKELRFIFPALTLFNLSGAVGLSKM